MDMAVGVRRAVVQGENGTAGAGRLDFFIETDFLPLADEFRFPVRQIAPHREFGLRQVERILVIHDVLQQIFVTKIELCKLAK